MWKTKSLKFSRSWQDSLPLENTVSSIYHLIITTTQTKPNDAWDDDDSANVLTWWSLDSILSGAWAGDDVHGIQACIVADCSITKSQCPHVDEAEDTGVAVHLHHHHNHSMTCCPCRNTSRTAAVELVLLRIVGYGGGGLHTHNPPTTYNTLQIPTLLPLPHWMMMLRYLIRKWAVQFYVWFSTPSCPVIYEMFYKGNG